MAEAVLRECSIPFSPVQALALPLLRTTARAVALRKCSIEIRTGAAFTRFVVKVAAAIAGTSDATSAKSSRFFPPGLMPQETAPARKPRAAQTPPGRLRRFTFMYTGRPFHQSPP